MQAPQDWQRQCMGALKLSSDADDDEVLRLLALPGADLSADPTGVLFRGGDNAGEHLARRCAYYGRTRVLLWLIEQGVDLHAVDRVTRSTAALFAAQAGSFEALRCIVELEGVEALRAVASDGGWTCAHYAMVKGNLLMLQWIRRRRASRRCAWQPEVAPRP